LVQLEADGAIRIASRGGIRSKSFSTSKRKERLMISERSRGHRWWCANIPGEKGSFYVVGGLLNEQTPEKRKREDGKERQRTRKKVSECLGKGTPVKIIQTSQRSGDRG